MEKETSKKKKKIKKSVFHLKRKPDEKTPIVALSITEAETEMKEKKLNGETPEKAFSKKKKKKKKKKKEFDNFASFCVCVYLCFTCFCASSF